MRLLITIILWTSNEQTNCCWWCCCYFKGSIGIKDFVMVNETLPDYGPICTFYLRSAVEASWSSALKLFFQYFKNILLLTPFWVIFTNSKLLLQSSNIPSFISGTSFLSSICSLPCMAILCCAILICSTVFLFLSSLSTSTVFFP